MFASVSVRGRSKIKISKKKKKDFFSWRLIISDQDKSDPEKITSKQTEKLLIFSTTERPKELAFASLSSKMFFFFFFFGILKLRTY